MYERFISSSIFTECCCGIRSAIVGAWCRGQGAGCRCWVPAVEACYAAPCTTHRAWCAQRPTSDVEILDVERIVLDEFPPWLHLVTHERGEHQVGFGVIFGAHLQQR